MGAKENGRRVHLLQTVFVMENSETISRAEIEDALSRVLRSASFTASPTLVKFLTYVVEEKLAGREADLKAYSIAVDALGRSEDFNAQDDPVVRVTAGRLRAALNQYYSGEGKQDPLRIAVPIGGYRPIFASATSAAVDLPPPQPVVKSGPLPPKKVNLSGRVILAGIALFFAGVLAWFGVVHLMEDFKEADDHIHVLVRMQPRPGGEEGPSREIVRALRGTLSRNSALTVLVSGERGGEPYAVDFIVDLAVTNLEGKRKLAVELIESSTNILIWAHALPLRPADGAELPVRLAVRRAAREVTTRILDAVASGFQNRDPQTLSPQQLFLLATWLPGPAVNSLVWEKSRVALARLALEKAPEFGPAYSVLADKLAYLAAVDGPSNTPAALEKAGDSAARALDLAAANSNALFNVAQYYWHTGRLSASARTMRRVAELDPSHVLAEVLALVYPHTCAPAPAEVLDAVVAYDQSLSADNPARWITQTWLGWLHFNRNEFTKALRAEQRAAQIFSAPHSIVRHAAILVRINRRERAAALLATHLGNWPNLDPAHFSRVTIPRLCAEEEQANVILSHYEALTNAMLARRTR